MHPMTRIFPVALAALLLGASAPALALNPPGAQDLFGTRSLSMGNAFRAVASSNEALIFNPAGVAVGRRYEIDGTYGFSPGDRLGLLNVSVVDSKSSPFGAGIAYSHLSGTGDLLDASGSIVHLGLGFPLGTRVAWGVGFKYLGFSRPEESSAITADLGLLIRPVEILTLGVVAYNVVDIANEQAPFRMGGGVSLGTDSTFRLAVDGVFAMDEADPFGTTYHVGGELFVDRVLPIRLGYERREGEDRHFATAGVGWVTHLAGLEAAYAQGLGKGRGEERIFSFTLKLFL